MKTPTPPLLEMDPDAPPTDDELRAAAELRDALSDPTHESEDAAFARALVLAHSPRSLDAEANAALVARALAPPEATVVSLVAVRSARVRRVRVAAAVSVLALAAAALVFQASSPARVAAVAPALPMRARSTQPLFREPFAARGGASARIDRIASARADDLRANMFARWEVQ